MDVVTGRLRPDEAKQEARLRAQAFQQQPGPYHDPDRPTVENDRIHVARATDPGSTGAGLTDRIVAALTVIPSGQWFGGRSLPMGGISGVVVAPEARGHGLARRLLAEALVVMRDRGEIISTLYPTTSELYRSMGYGFAGRWERTTVDIATLARLIGPGGGRIGDRSADRSGGRGQPGLTVEPLSPGRLQRIRPLYDSLAAESNGWMDRSDLFWDRLDYSVDPERSNSFGYAIVDGGGQVVGGLTVAHRAGSDGLRFGVDVGGPLAASPEAMTAALGLVAGLGTTADRATLSMPVEQLAVDLPGAVLDHEDSWLWMMRLVDVGAALRARGYNPAVSCRFRFDLIDQTAPWNTGRWTVGIADGGATVEVESKPGADSGVSRLDVQTLSAMFTGFLNPWDLARAGRLPGADRPLLEALGAAFSGPPPRLVDFF